MTKISEKLVCWTGGGGGGGNNFSSGNFGPRTIFFQDQNSSDSLQSLRYTSFFDLFLVLFRLTLAPSSRVRLRETVVTPALVHGSRT